MKVCQNDVAYSVRLTCNKIKTTFPIPPDLEEQIARVGDLRVRASSVSDILKCRAIPYFPRATVENHPRAELGSIVHDECHKAIVSNFEDYDTSKVNEDYIDLTKSFINSGSLYASELPLSRRLRWFMSLTGSCDFVAIKNNRASIVDLKEGRHKVKVENNKQLYTYAFMLLSFIPHIEFFDFYIVQDSVRSSKNITRKEIENFGSVLKKIPHTLKFYVSFDNCTGCFKSTQCTFGSHILRNMKDALAGNLKDLREVEKVVDNLFITKYTVKRAVEEIEEKKDVELFSYDNTKGVNDG